MNPYDPPATIRSTIRLSILQWLAVVVCAGLSALGTIAIISNIFIFSSLPRWPNTLWQWFGVVLMTFAMLLFAFGMGWTSWGILFQNQRRWRIGIFCSGASVLCYVVCVAFAITMRILYPDAFPFGQGPN